MRDRSPIAAIGERCQPLAERLQLPLAASVSDLPPDCIAWLGFLDERLRLFPIDPRQSGPIGVDFDEGPALRRAQGGSELIVKAVRGRSRETLRVVDATAGLGRDSFVLASRGFEVTAIERDPIVAALLADGLERARGADVDTAAIAARIRLQCGDAAAYLAALSAAEIPDVVYLDPMFPPSQKTALVKKEMRLFQQILHGDASATEDDDAGSLLAAALAAARLRVVVKRPAKAAPLAAREPDYVLAGKAIRFDVYLGRAAGTD